MIAHKPGINLTNFSGVSKFWLSIELADFNARRLWKHGRQRPISPLHIQILSSTCNMIAIRHPFFIFYCKMCFSSNSFFPFKWIETKIGLLVWRVRLFSIFLTQFWKMCPWLWLSFKGVLLYPWYRDNAGWGNNIQEESFQGPKCTRRPVDKKAIFGPFWQLLNQKMILFKSSLQVRVPTLACAGMGEKGGLSTYQVSFFSQCLSHKL